MAKKKEQALIEQELVKNWMICAGTPPTMLATYFTWCVTA
jgi:hypothetical protein